MSLSDHIENLVDEITADPNNPDVEYRPKTEFDGVSGYIQTGPLRSGEHAEDWSDILEQFGYDPAKVRIVGSPRVSRWQQRSAVREADDQGRMVRTGEYETVWLEAYKFQLAPTTATADYLDIEAAIARHQQTPPAFAPAPYWFVFQAGDQQIGKRSRDGSTEEILGRYLRSIDAAKEEFQDAKRLGIEGIQISLPGDCIEGNQSQGGTNLWLTKETITEQTRILRRMMMYTVEQFAPLCGKVYLDVVNGNHDRAQNDKQQQTYPGNGWATDCALAIGERLGDRPDQFGHVTVRVPDKWSGFMTVPVGDTVVTVMHGHQFRVGKAFDWWSRQAVNNQPPGAAHILQHGHYHTWNVDSTRDKTVIQSPTFDCGSDWYREKTGATSRRGALTYLLRAGEVSRMSVV